MEINDLDEYEGIFDDDEVVDNLIYDKVENDLDEKKTAGCFTTILAISGCGLLCSLLLILI
ncbi:MAG TPA: hypothetical protein VJ946_05980 [Bacteroidales bacterium]|nr:hypothetical protein [Bacteroidales bacterium]